MSETRKREATRRPTLVLSSDPHLIAATRIAARRARRSPVLVMRDGEELLARLVAPASQAGHLVCDPRAAGPSWPHLLQAFAEPWNRTTLVVIGEGKGALPAGVTAIRPEAGQLYSALRAAPPSQSRAELPRGAAEALRRAIERRELVVSYQPIVRMADRRPLLIEALARWPYRRRLIAPSAFIPLAEAAGLTKPLAAAVAGRIARDHATHCVGLPLGVTLNLPLSVVLCPWLVKALRLVFAGTRLRPAQLAIELTETAPRYDHPSLRRALLRLRAAGHGILLDDVLLDDPRQTLFDLPFTGLKLDRTVVERLPHEAAVRRNVGRFVADAHARGQMVIAEGISDARLWAAAAALGVDAAQGWLVGRPMPAAAIGVWRNGWRGGRRGQDDQPSRAIPPR